MKKIKIFDTTLRDGDQSPGCSMTLEEKVRFAKQLEKLNVDIIEAGFAASSDEDLKAIQEISKNIKKPIITSLARCNKIDIDKAYESLKFAKKKRIHVFIATSQDHMKNKLHMNEDEVLMKVRQMVSYAKSLCDDIEFSLEDATRTDKDFMIKVISIAIDSGANVINIPDTVGKIIPSKYAQIINYIMENVPNINQAELSTHCHNDKGLATANTLAAIKEGVTQVECTVNGIGERAGNASLEQIVMNIKDDENYYNAKTNIEIGEIINSSKMLVDITGSIVQRNAPIVGENAFKHEAGIHAAAVDCYEIFNSNELGIKDEKIVIGIHSGHHSILEKMKKMNIDIDENLTDKYVKRIKNYFSENKTIDDETFKKVVSDQYIKTKKK